MGREIIIRADGSVFPYDPLHAAKSNFFTAVFENGVVVGPPMAHAAQVRAQVSKDLGIPVANVHIDDVPALSVVPTDLSPAPDAPAAPDPLSGVDDVPPAVLTDDAAPVDAPAGSVESLTKAQLGALARAHFGVELDPRRNKADLVAQVKALASPVPVTQ